MSRPQFVTFTGLDAKTNLKRVNRISADYPVEFGILFSGRTGNRYPDDEVIAAISNLEDVRLSLHFCGKYSAAILNRSDADPDVLTRLDKFEFAHNAALRFQVNAAYYDGDSLKTFADAVGGSVIMQVRGEVFPEPINGIIYLHDPSGGRGIVPASRPPQEPAMPLVGYAGGITPNNVLEVIASLDAHTYYLDMETGVRATNDWLDLDKCEAVCKQIWPELG
jgi:hypothetical protein